MFIDVSSCSLEVLKLLFTEHRFVMMKTAAEPSWKRELKAYTYLPVRKIHQAHSLFFYGGYNNDSEAQREAASGNC